MTGPRRPLLPWLSLLVVYVVWGSTYLAIRVVVQEMPPFAAAALRFLASGLVMLGIALVVDRKHPRPTRRQLADYALVGVLLLSFGNGLVMSAERAIPSGIAALIVATVPLWIVLLDGLRAGGQPWTPRAWVGALVGFAGVALVARPEGELTSGHWKGRCRPAGGRPLVDDRVSLRPVAAGEAAALHRLRRGDARGLGGALPSNRSSSGEDPGRLFSASETAWGALAYLGTFGSLVGFTAFAYCLNELPASTVGTYAYVNPVVAVALGAAILDEPLSPGLLLGGLLIVASVALTPCGRGSRRPRPERCSRRPSRRATLVHGQSAGTRPLRQRRVP